jgi:predicted acyltransferase
MKSNLSNRLVSLDVLRGFDMLFIMGLSSLIVAVSSLFPDVVFMKSLSEQMKHTHWDGLTLYDTIFPLFLFIAGVSFPYSLEKQRSDGKSVKEIHYRILKRGFVLVVLGFVYNGIFKLDFENMRYASVLGRIGLAWMFAALFFTNFKTNINIAVAIIILVGYWLLLWLIPDAINPYSFEDNIVGAVDRMLLPGRLNAETFDPEGILSTLPAVVTALLGMFTGQFIKYQGSGISGKRKVLLMLVAAMIFLLVGYAWDLVFPINKNLWSSSFVCVLAGYSLLLLAIFYYIIDIKGWCRWAFFFKVVGVNSITIYLAQRIIDFKKITNFFMGGVIDLFPGEVGEIIKLTGYISVCWLFLYFLYKQKIFLKV